MFNRGIYINLMEDELEEHEFQVNGERVYHARPNYLADMDDDEFCKRFRLSKATFKMVLDMITNKISSMTDRNQALTPEIKLLLTLRYYASGNFLITVGDFCGVSVPSACRAVRDVSGAIAALAGDFIKFHQPHTSTVDAFFRISKFPKVVGTIDCTHVRIQSPGGDCGEIFRNRKGYFSFNVQAVCDANLIFQDLVARWPGSSHDSMIFNNSRLKYRVDSGEFGQLYILGDGGYKASSYMLTPLLNPITRPQKLYNESQIRTRNVVERCFGVWKRRFPVLSLGMRLKVSTEMSVIVACGVLHNLCIIQKDPVPPEMHTNELTTIFDNEIIIAETSSNARTTLINNYFARYINSFLNLYIKTPHFYFFHFSL